MSKRRLELLTEAQWELVGPLLPEPKRSKDNRGRPWASNRQCLEGSLWVLRTGSTWRFLPDKYPSPATCWRRLKQWEEQDVWLDAWRALLGALNGEGLLQWEETFLDGSFAPVKKGAPRSEKPSAARERSGWYWSTAAVFHWEFGWKVPIREKLRLRKPRLPRSESPGAKGRPRQKPKRVIADRAYDSDPLLERLHKRGIELIVPYRKNSKLRKHEDGRKLRRYKRCWIVERTEAWLGQFRRLLVRHEHLLSTYRAFFYLACLWITLRR